MAHPREILKMGTQLTMLGIEPLELTTFIELLKHNAGMSIAHDTTDIESLVEAICHLS